MGAAGGGLRIGANFMASNAAAQTKRALRRIAETPGLDLEAQTAEARQLQSGTQQMESQRNQFNADELNKMLETSIPGYASGQAQRIGNSEALMRGEVPGDVMGAIARGSAAHALEGGYGGGSGMGRNLEARDLGRTSLDLMNQGGQQFAGIIGSTPRAQLANYTLTPEQIIQLRAKERSDKIRDSMAAEGAPGFNQVFSQDMMAAGKELTGAAMGGSPGGSPKSGGGSSGSNPFTSGPNSDAAMADGGT